MNKQQEKKEKKTFTNDSVSSLRIKISGYDVNTVEESISRIISQITKIGLSFSGIVCLPVKREIVTVLRSPHKHSSSKEHFERRIHKRFFYIFNVKKTHLSILSNIQLPHSVEIKAENKS